MKRLIKKSKESMKWFVFNAINKENKQVNEKIPADSWEEAQEELGKMGYTNIVYDSEFTY